MTKNSVPAFDDDTTRWGAVRARDPRADRHFVYSVATTGILCRPSCPSRLANRENVRFHDSADQAVAMGFRACKRCHPHRLSPRAQQAGLVARACEIIEYSDTVPTLDELAHSVGLSAHHFHRLFRRVTGMTPKAYGQACQDQRVQQLLKDGKSVTHAIFESGFESSSPFYARSVRILGMQPREYRSGGEHADICFAVGESSLGSILVAATTVGVCAVLMGDDAVALLHDLEDRFPNARLIGGDADFERLVARVVAHVERPKGELDVPMDIRGTVFQRRVWRALLDLPFGETASYKQIAATIGSPRSSRAVANACSANALAVVIPCHRVVCANGSPGGYRWGLERKRVLLDRESCGNAVSELNPNS